MTQPKVYIASKICHAERWIELRKVWPEVRLVMRWPFMIGRLGDNSPENAYQFWQDDLADVREADVVLVYGDETGHLRGALVEAGMGIALGKKIIVVGEHADYSSWQYHPAVARLNSMKAAHYLLAKIGVGRPWYSRDIEEANKHP